MNVLYFATDVETLATQFAREIANRQTPDDFFSPQTVIVPNRFIGSWLKFFLARQHGVAINLRFSYLEHALWDWLREIDPRTHPSPPEFLEEENYQILVLAVLLSEEDPALHPFQDYFHRGDAEASTSGNLSRLGCRRVWHLAQRLASGIRDYEYHRQESIIQPWILGDSGLADIPHWREQEQAQRAVFRHIIREPDGKRALLNTATGRNFKTLPQYVMELRLDVKEYRTPLRRTIHLFGVGQVSPLHLRALESLVPFHDWRVYHNGPLVSRFPVNVGHSDLKELAHRYRAVERPDGPTGTELLHIWGRAGAEALDLSADFSKIPSFKTHVLVDRERRGRTASTVLHRLRQLVLDGEAANEKLAQDSSVQIVGCPGIAREVETIHNSILHNLQRDPTLKQSDIGVLVADMEPYRPHFMAVFERPPRPLGYNLADYPAARLSVFGQAVLAMLDLALESLTRSRVFEVLHNPCFLAALGVDGSAAGVWTRWVEALGVYQGWDERDKEDNGLYGSPLFAWKLGMQRLRMGRYMDAYPEDRGDEAPRWRDVVPFADVESTDREQLDAFCQAVEGLLPRLVRLRHFHGTGRQWAKALRSLVERFLRVPDDRPEETPIRDAVLTALDRLDPWDAISSPDLSAHARLNGRLPLALVREYIASHLQQISGRRHEFLTNGVTISSLQAQRPIPFRVLYLAGMGEQHFPGSPFPSPFDLRHARRQHGDILPVEQQRYAFLEAILSAREKLYLTFNQRDVQRDQELQPAAPLLQLKRFLEQHVVKTAPFHKVTVPLHGHSLVYLNSEVQPPYQDVFVQYRGPERLLAIDDAIRLGKLVLRDLESRFEIEDQRKAIEQSVCLPPIPLAPRTTPHKVTLRNLRKFLQNPAEAAIEAHLAIRDDAMASEEHEPLVSSAIVAAGLKRNVIERLVHRSESESIRDLEASWRKDFETTYHDWTLRCQVPEHAFGRNDFEDLVADLENRLIGPKGLFTFLDVHAKLPACGPVLIGENTTPIGARRIYPALLVPLKLAAESSGIGTLRKASDGTHNHAKSMARLVGSWPMAWHDERRIHVLAFQNKDEEVAGRIDEQMLDPLLFLMTWALVATDIAGSEFVLHRCLPTGISSASFPSEALRSAVSRQYLEGLVNDFFDPTCADLIPFALINEKDYLRQCYTSFHDTSLARLFANNLEKQIEGAFGNDRYPELRRANFRVPSDSYDKVHRRFAPLHELLGGAKPLTPPIISDSEESTDGN